jgi:DNA-binding transcriptional MocR family regulator
VHPDPTIGMGVGHRRGDEFQAAIDAHPVCACVVTPSFQNPLGSRMPDPAARKRPVTMLGPRGIPIIEDDTFAELPFDGARPRSLRVWDDWDQVLRCGSFGKTLAPGYRIGWIVPGPRHFDAVRQCRLATTIAASMPPQLALARYLASGGYDRHLRRLRTTLRDNVARLAAEVAARFPEGTRISRPAGGFVLWVELPDELDALELFDGARRMGISVCPGPVFSASGGYRNCIRLSAGHLWSEETEQAVQTLAELLRAQRSGRQDLRE